MESPGKNTPFPSVDHMPVDVLPEIEPAKFTVSLFAQTVKSRPAFTFGLSKR